MEGSVISLNKQIYIYSVDTSAFYNQTESKINDRLNRYYFLRSKLKDLTKTKNTKYNPEKIRRIISKINIKIKRYKNNLTKEIGDNCSIRELNSKHLNTHNIVSVFDSSLTRTLKNNEGEISNDIFIVRTYFFKVLKDLIEYGFVYDDEKYICFTASAGQIRTKKTVFIKKSLLDKYGSTLTCGLSVDAINNKGGVNINKYLAYLALCFSATDPWPQFNVDKSIVVDDMETTVRSLVDFVDDKNYVITRQEMDIPINHTDGIGMILPKKNKKSMMIRLPWIKGLLVPFPFDKFVREAKKNHSEQPIGKVKDIYGKEYDIIKDGIEIIFTKSQFKLWKFYSSWDEYKEKYNLYNCHASKCNEEEDRFRKAKLNYQMLQTLTDFSDDELAKICGQTINKIINITRDRQTMLNVLGVKETNYNKDYFQKAIEIYPELLQDTYSKELFKQIKKSLVKAAKSGKIEIDGFYTFICPDLFAFCEYIFLKDRNPTGLLQNGEVSCKLYKDDDKLDCLRSPHLYREHAVRINAINKEITRWFVTRGLYTSCHDPISKLLQFDVDGDKALVCKDETLVSVAERNMSGIVPLYYDMKKAAEEKITPNEIYNGLTKAYTGGNIGVYSNDITKIWNSDNVDIDLIKLLCMENNFVIDYAKTLYKPTRPTDVHSIIKNYTHTRNPHFFIYAKDKKVDNVEKINKSVINRIQQLIPNPRILFKASNVGVFNYKMLLSNPNKQVCIKSEEKLLDSYRNLDLKKRFMVSSTNDSDEAIGDSYIYREIRYKLAILNPDIFHIVDVLVEYLYRHKDSSYKTTLWSSFGDILIQNIGNNIKQALSEEFIQCEVCGERVKETNNRRKYCIKCRKDKQKEWQRNSMKKMRSDPCVKF
ncbi:RNA dependent RNA polymerase [Paenibacillus chitinolyticus]|uniref:RNA dependent RNA polymerase n=1 Tax=Paenibacillus chitinolyticus TaxID=79263 RepID=UPI0036716AEF